MIVIVCGVSGTGKSTIGELLSNKLQIPFFDGDDFHPEFNVNKMQSGLALTDEDREPWLALLSAKLMLWENHSGAVLACSALKESYRKVLASQCKTEIKWVVLHGSTELLTERLVKRKGHFFKPHLLTSQLDILELPNYGLVVDIESTPSDIVNRVSMYL